MAVTATRIGATDTGTPTQYSTTTDDLGEYRLAGLATALAQVAQSSNAEQTGAALASQAQRLVASDIVSLHCPLTRQTHHLIDARALSLMKPTAILVNTARGPIVDMSTPLVRTGRMLTMNGVSGSSSMRRHRTRCESARARRSRCRTR